MSRTVPARSGERTLRLYVALLESGAVAYVAELDGALVGVITGHAMAAIHSTPTVAWLTALVVTKTARGKGVGRRLVERLEQWAVERGAAKISLTSALHRSEAHAFYEGIGYARTGVRLTKNIGPT